MEMKFKLRSSKILFGLGVLVTIIVTGFAVFREKQHDVYTTFKETQSYVFGEIISHITSNIELIRILIYSADHFIRFIIIFFVLLVNLYFSSKLVEGVIHRQVYKISPWIVLNLLNLIQFTIFAFQIDTSIAYLALVVYLYTWMTIVCLFFEVLKDEKLESIAMNQQSRASVETIDVPYNNISRQSVWKLNKNQQSDTFFLNFFSFYSVLWLFQ